MKICGGRPRHMRRRGVSSVVIRAFLIVFVICSAAPFPNSPSLLQLAIRYFYEAKTENRPSHPDPTKIRCHDDERPPSLTEVTYDPEKIRCHDDERPPSLTEVTYDPEEIARRYVRETSSINSTVWNYVKPAMTTSEKQTIRLLLRIFDDLATSHNFAYLLMSGSLFGSYRHHGLTPWDDDVDILMRISQRDVISEAFKAHARRSTDIEVVDSSQLRLKLFLKTRSIRIAGKKHRWPNIDISFYHENETHVWERNEKKIKGSQGYVYHVLEKTLIFPLKRRPFEGLWMKSPRDTFAVLSRLAKKPNYCISLSYIHKEEISVKGAIKFDCELVSQFYPFVHRRAINDTSCMEETLKMNNNVLHTVLVNEPLYAVSKPYLLKLETGVDRHIDDNFIRQRQKNKIKDKNQRKT